MIVKSRIAILDGFRAVAILAVLLFHFFSRYVPPFYETSLYPYDDQYNYFGNGKLGVRFFFIVSGFVIFYTLDNTSHFAEFWKKRLIRLVPSMVVATIITYMALQLFDNNHLFPNSHQIINFIPSITFISPDLFNAIFSTQPRFDYISGSYWSLWPEIQFYVLGSLLFYVNKKGFVRNFLLISFLLIAVNWFFIHVQTTNKLNIQLPPGVMTAYSKWVTNIFNLADYLPFFSIGVIFYILFKNKQGSHTTPLLIKLSLAALMLFQIHMGNQTDVRVIYILMFSLFFGFIYYPYRLRFLESGLLIRIGVSSYFLYLIHENIGVLLINSLGEYFLPAGFILPIIVIALLIVSSIFFTEKFDNRIISLLKNTFVKRQAASKQLTEKGVIIIVKDEHKVLK
jgi:peptidoglycan/LPS O-acetylase OafA/YrhL